eukprot:568735-Prorocentrum_lima.AAC.1
MTSSLVGSEMCIRDRVLDRLHLPDDDEVIHRNHRTFRYRIQQTGASIGCLLYTSDAADDM